MSYDPYVADPSQSARSRSDFIGELNDAIRQNPVPAALVGVGILWLFMGGRNVLLGGASHSILSGVGHGAQHAGGAAYRGARDVGELVSAGVSAVADTAAEAGSQLTGAVRSAKHAMGDAVRQTEEKVTDAASGMGDRIWSQSSDATRGASHESGTDTSNVGRRVHDTLADLFAQQPLLLGALGLAVGAGIAASMPTSETENRLMGESADTVKHKAGELWKDTTKRGADIASQGLEEAKVQGLTPEAVGEAARTIASKVAGVAEKASKDVVARVKG
jgi:hypothetical protein